MIWNKYGAFLRDFGLVRGVGVSGELCVYRRFFFKFVVMAVGFNEFRF